MNEEIWKDIRGFEGKYQVSNFGRIKSYPNKSWSTERILNPWKNYEGYLLIDLCKDGKVYHKRVNRLVAMTFNPCFDKNLEVAHIDENKENNCADNLEWITHKENCGAPIRNSKLIHNPRNEVICDGIIYRSVRKCAEELGVKYKTIWLWLHGNTIMPDEWKQRGLRYA